MIYTFQQRRKLNSELKGLHPDIPWQEFSQSVPRMRTRLLPQGCKRVISTDILEEQVRDCYLTSRRPLPVYVLLPAICRGDEDEYDANYLDLARPSSMEYACRMIAQKRLFVSVD